MIRKISLQLSLIIFTILYAASPLYSLDKVTVVATSGTTSGSYSTLGAAFTAINGKVHTGSITIKLNASFTETESPVALRASGTAGSYTSIKIYPTTANVTISGTRADFIDLQGANNVTIDGSIGGTGSDKNLTIENTSSGSHAIYMHAGACNNTLRYLTIKGGPVSGLNGIIKISVGSSDNSGNNNNVIDHCDLTASSAGKPGVAIYAAGNATYSNKNCTISNCNIYDFVNPALNSDECAIFLNGYNDGWTIEHNSIYETTPIEPSNYFKFYGIKLNGTSGCTNTISNNYIGGRATQCSSGALTNSGSSGIYNSFYGIYASGAGTHIITNNVISNIDWTSPMTSSSYIHSFIYIANATTYTCDGNTIGSVTGTGSIKITSSNYSAYIYGIYSNCSDASASISGNKIGGITLTNISTMKNSHFYGIYDNQSAVIENNLIGSLNIENSISCGLSSGAQYMRGIYRVLSSAATVKTNGNTIMNMTNLSTIAGSEIRAIDYRNNSNSVVCEVTNNKIASLKASGTSNQDTPLVTGINCDNTSATSGSICSRNLIYDLSAASANAECRGINLGTGSWEVTNNMVSLGSGITSGAGLYGIYSMASPLNLYYNSARIMGTATSGTYPTYAIYDGATIEGTRNIKNNIAVNGRTGGTGTHYAVSISSNTGLAIDYNNYYTPNTESNNVLGKYSNTDKASLADFREATGQDAYSVSTAVTFAGDNDLHLNNGLEANHNLVGTSISGFATDYDNDTRHIEFPYMGADECATALPVELSAFTASVTKAGTVLNWTTATELNNYGFEIERAVMSSELGVLSYEKIGFVAGAGNSNSTRNYSFTDNTAKAGKYSYRLKQVDNDGKYKFSETVETLHATSLQPENYALSQNYPNPFNPATVISYQLPQAAHVTLKVYDMLGKEVATLVDKFQEAGTYNSTFRTNNSELRTQNSELTTGIYIYKLKAGSFTAAKKMMLVK